MHVQTDCGIPIYCLPDCARCNLSGRSPEKMVECPARRFDDFGLVCKPETCPEYREDEG